MRHDNAKELHATINRSIASKSPLMISFEHLMASSKPTTPLLKSKWNIDDAIEFQESYERVASKTDYVQSLSNEKNTPLDEK